jgi:phage repressor protein C with HTH and peptisase S24 domain/DNA-binding XRE family transcriptional regulator
MSTLNRFYFSTISVYATRMKTLGEMIKKSRKDLKMTQTDLATKVGQSQKTVSDWENDNVSQIRGWEKVADVLGIDRDLFMELMSSAVLTNPSTKRVAPAVRDFIESQTPKRTTRDIPTIVAEQISSLGTRDVPVYGRAKGGEDGLYQFNGDVLGWETRPPILAGVKEAYAIYVDGESMFPRYKPGETVWINPNIPPSRGADVIVQLHPSDEDDPPHGFIKEFIGWSPNHLRLHQWNPVGEITYPRDRVKSVHPIVYSQR